MDMTVLQNVYNIIIACLPALTSILAVLTGVSRIIAIINNFKKDAKKDKEKSDITIAELKLQNKALQEDMLIMSNNMKELHKNVDLVIRKVRQNEDRDK